MTAKRKEKRQSSITVEHSTAPGERAIQHPRRVSPKDVSAFGAVKVSRPQRFRNGKLVAVGGIPVNGHQPLADSETFAENSAGDVIAEYLGDGHDHVQAWEHHAIEMYLQGNDEAINCF